MARDLTQREEMQPKNPTVFISYSWDSDIHRDWVKHLAGRLRSEGAINAIIDEWTLAPGDQLSSFMEDAVMKSDYILIICTKNYKRKSDRRKGGVGYEGDIMTAQVLSGANRRKFIPLLREGTPKSSIPHWLSGSLYVNFCNNDRFDTELNGLINHLTGGSGCGPAASTLPQVNEDRMSNLIKTEQALLVDEAVLNRVMEFFSKLSGFPLNNIGRLKVIKLLRTYEPTFIMEAMNQSVAQYCIIADDGNSYIRESVEKAFNTVSKLCYVITETKTKPYYRDIVMIRGILRNRISYIREADALSILEQGALNGIPIEKLRSLAKDAYNWTEWKQAMEKLINQSQHRSPE